MPVKASLKVSSCPLGKWGSTVDLQDIEATRAFLDGMGQTLTAEQNAELTRRYNALVGANQRPTTCTSCIRNMVASMREFLERSESENGCEKK